MSEFQIFKLRVKIFYSYIFQAPTDQQESTENSPEITRRSVLLFKTVRDTDLGLYECRAENKIGVQLLHVELTGNESFLC